MIHQDGPAQRATAKHADSITIPGIQVTETNSDSLLVVCFSAEGTGQVNQLEPSVTYGGMSLVQIGQGVGTPDGTHFGGVWVYAIGSPTGGHEVAVSFNGVIADDIAAVASVFHGVDLDNPIGFHGGAYSSDIELPGSSQSAGSLFLSAMVSGSGEENQFAAGLPETDIIARVEAGDMSLNIAATEVSGEIPQSIGLSQGADRSLSALAVIEFCPVSGSHQQVESLSVIEVEFQGQKYPVHPGTTSEDGTAATGRYGTLTIGADGSYTYLTDQAETENLPAESTVQEQFSYVLSNGEEASTANLVVEAKIPARDPDGTDVGDGAGYCITEIAVGDSRPIPVAPGSTSVSGAATIKGYYGTLTIGADGSYEYAVNESLAGSNMLAPVEMFTYTLSDGVHKEYDQLNISVTIPDLPSEEVDELGSSKSQEPTQTIFRVTFADEVQDANEDDFEIIGVPDARVVKLSQVAGKVYDVTIEAVNLDSYKGKFTITYVGVPQQKMVEKTAEAIVAVPDISERETVAEDEGIGELYTGPPPQVEKKTVKPEGKPKAFFSPDMMVSSGVPRSFSDFSNVQYTAEIDIADYRSGNGSSVGTGSLLPSTVSTGTAVPKQIESNEVSTPPFPRRRKTTAWPLNGITKLFREPDDPRFFGGFKVNENRIHKGRIAFDPYFAGASSPSATIRIIIQDSFGIEVKSIIVNAEMSGYWTACPEIDLDDTIYHVIIEETPATWGDLAFPARSMVAEFSGAVNVTPELMENLAPGQIIGEIIVSRSMDEWLNKSDHPQEIG
ncbi:MAG: VCBS domain-containing protein [Verrucomicrobiales bacterium]|nr:VCBS domain-containing protein [Verrucomicrobiales bacterium]